MTTTKKITVIPGPGLLTMNPATGQPLPSAEERPQGTRVPLNTYWHKRVACGDVRDITPAEKPADESSAAEGGSASAGAGAPASDAPQDEIKADTAATPTEAPATSKTSKPKDR